MAFSEDMDHASMAHGQALAVLGLLMAGDAQGREHKIIKMSRIWQIFRNIYFFSNNFFMNSEPQALYCQLVEQLKCFPIIPRPGPWGLRLSDRPGMWKRNLIWLLIQRCSQYEDESEDDDIQRYDDEDSGEEMEDREEEGGLWMKWVSRRIEKRKGLRRKWVRVWNTLRGRKLTKSTMCDT